jgi:hypothetical protein
MILRVRIIPLLRDRPGSRKAAEDQQGGVPGNDWREPREHGLDVAWARDRLIHDDERCTAGRRIGACEEKR